MSDEILKRLNKMDENDKKLVRRVDDLTDVCHDIKVLLYGSKQLRLIGVAELLDELKKSVNDLEEEKRAVSNQLRGFKYAAIMLGMTSAGGLMGLINELLK